MWKRLRPQTLDLYVLKRFLAIYASNLVSFTLLFVMIDLITHFEDFGKQAGGIGGFLAACFKYYSAITPLIYCQVLGPVVSISAALFAVTTFERANELTPMLATGRSQQRTFAPVLAASLVVSAGIFLIQEKWLPRTVTAIREAKEGREARSTEKHVIHLDDDFRNLIVLREYDRLARRAVGVDVLPLPKRGANASFIRAKSAQWVAPAFASEESLKGYWLMKEGTIQEYDPDAFLVVKPAPPEWPHAPPRLFETFSEMPLRTRLTPEDLERRRNETMYMPLAELKRKAETSLGQSGWYMKYFSRFAYPLTNFILVLVGIPVIVHFANRNVFFGALLALGISTAYFVSNSVCQDLGIQGTIPVRLGAGLAPTFFMALGATLYREMRS